MRRSATAKQLQDRALERRAAIARSALDRTRPTVLGAAEAATLLDKRETVFRGRGYRVGAIPFADGAALTHLLANLRGIGQEGNAEKLQQWAATFAAIAKRCSRPTSFLERLRWRDDDYNPFLSATGWEVGQLAAFFWILHQLDEAVHAPSQLKTTVPQPTSSSTSGASSQPSPRSSGPSQKRMSRKGVPASPSAGSTS